VAVDTTVSASYWAARLDTHAESAQACFVSDRGRTVQIQIPAPIRSLHAIVALLVDGR
jgi:hypothetical protein